MKFAMMAALSFLTLAQAAQANGLNFTLINDTGYDIAMVFLDPNSSNFWTDDIMEEDILPNGSGVRINFVGDFESCVWDMKVEWTEDYEPTYWQGLNLCNISEVTLQYDQDSDVTTAFVK